MWEDTEIHVLTIKYVTVKYKFVNDRTMLELNDEKLYFFFRYYFSSHIRMNVGYMNNIVQKETEEFLQEYLSGMLSLLQIKFIVGCSKT